MGLNFRKSIKIAPGVKLNLGKKSAGISMGGKYGGLSYNTKTGAKARVSAPGTGISYTAKLNNSKNVDISDNFGNSGTSNNVPDDQKPKKGCCIWILLIPLICLIGYIFAEVIIKLGWIPGIIWLIFFRRKMKNDSNKQKKYTLIISLLSITSFLLFFRYNVEFSDENDIPPNTEPLINTEISSEVILDTETDETEINSETNSEIINTENNVDLNTEQTSESNSENQQPTTNSSGETSTNIQPSENQQPTTDSSEDTPANAQPSENQQPTTDSSSEDTPVVIPPQEEPAPSQTPSEEPVQEPEKSTMVWIPQSGSKYHSRSSCSNMKNPRQVTEESAINMGYEPCKRCY